MKVTISELKKYIPNLDWPIEKIADRLSMIGHESEVVAGDNLEVKITTNRKDCKDIKYLAFDLVALNEDLGDPSSIFSPNSGKQINVDIGQVNKLLGSNIDETTYQKLTRLGFRVEDGFVVAPDFRIDINDPADVAEEVFRFIGVDGIEVKQLDKLAPVESRQFELLNNIRFALATVGGNETRTISFSDRGVVELKNPFSKELPYLQPDLTDGLLETLAKNPFSRRNIFYEIADVFTPEESTHLAIVISGYKKPDQLIADLSRVVGKNLSFSAVDQKQLDKFSVKQPNVQVTEVSVDSLNPLSAQATEAKLPQFKIISQFPPLARDITVSQKIDVGSLHNNFPELLFAELIDTYTDPSSGRISDTYRLIFQKHDESFTAEEIQDIDERLDKSFFGAR